MPEPGASEFSHGKGLDPPADIDYSGVIGVQPTEDYDNARNLRALYRTDPADPGSTVELERDRAVRE